MKTTEDIRKETLRLYEKAGNKLSKEVTDHDYKKWLAVDDVKKAIEKIKKDSEGWSDNSTLLFTLKQVLKELGLSTDPKELLEEARESREETERVVSKTKKLFDL